MPGPVERWLETFMCKQYADTFEAYGFKTLQSVCQLQLHQLQGMGVAQEHCEKILENVHVLRQTLIAGNNKTTGLPEQSPPSAHDSTLVNSASSVLRSVAMNVNLQRGPMNHYPEDMPNPYGANTGRMALSSDYLTRDNPRMMSRGMSGYPLQSYGDHPSSHMMLSQQTSFHGHNAAAAAAMYNQHNQSQQFMGQRFSSPYQASHYSSMGAVAQSSAAAAAAVQMSAAQMSQLSAAQMSSMASNSMYSSSPASSSSSHNPHSHPYMRHSSSCQNPQQVADNILQMASVNYPSNQTVHVPINKSRTAPYHLPRSPQYSMQTCNSPVQPQMRHNAAQYGYPSTSPHPPAARTSPISPMLMHSPASHHSNQSMPNSSPVSLHSPAPANVKSPVTTPSPIASSLRSPCAVQSMTSPVGCGKQICSPPHSMNSSSGMQQSPLGSNSSSGYVTCNTSIKSPGPQHQQQQQQQQQQPPPQQHHHHHHQHHQQQPQQQQPPPPQHQQQPQQQRPPSQNRYSPHPIGSPISHAGSPYALSKAHINSPPQSQNFQHTPSMSPYVSDASQDSTASQSTAAPLVVKNPLQSLEKLVLLPESQVIDPKSVVNDACLPSPSHNNEGPKNCDIPSDHRNSGGCISSNSSSTSCSNSSTACGSTSCTDGKHCDNGNTTTSNNPGSNKSDYSFKISPPPAPNPTIAPLSLPPASSTLEDNGPIHGLITKQDDNLNTKASPQQVSVPPPSPTIKWDVRFAEDTGDSTVSHTETSADTKLPDQLDIPAFNNKVPFQSKLENSPVEMKHEVVSFESNKQDILDSDNSSTATVNSSVSAPLDDTSSSSAISNSLFSPEQNSINASVTSCSNTVTPSQSASKSGCLVANSSTDSANTPPHSMSSAVSAPLFSPPLANIEVEMETNSQDDNEAPASPKQLHCSPNPLVNGITDVYPSPDLSQSKEETLCLSPKCEDGISCSPKENKNQHKENTAELQVEIKLDVKTESSEGANNPNPSASLKSNENPPQATRRSPRKKMTVNTSLSTDANVITALTPATINTSTPFTVSSPVFSTSESSSLTNNSVSTPTSLSALLPATTTTTTTTSTTTTATAVKQSVQTSATQTNLSKVKRSKRIQNNQTVKATAQKEEQDNETSSRLRVRKDSGNTYTRQMRNSLLRSITTSQSKVYAGGGPEITGSCELDAIDDEHISRVEESAEERTNGCEQSKTLSNSDGALDNSKDEGGTTEQSKLELDTDSLFQKDSMELVGDNTSQSKKEELNQTPKNKKRGSSRISQQQTKSSQEEKSHTALGPATEENKKCLFERATHSTPEEEQIDNTTAIKKEPCDEDEQHSTTAAKASPMEHDASGEDSSRTPEPMVRRRRKRQDSSSVDFDCVVDTNIMVDSVSYDENILCSKRKKTIKSEVFPSRNPEPETAPIPKAPVEILEIDLTDESNPIKQEFPNNMENNSDLSDEEASDSKTNELCADPQLSLNVEFKEELTPSETNETDGAMTPDKKSSTSAGKKKKKGRPPAKGSLRGRKISRGKSDIYSAFGPDSDSFKSLKLKKTMDLMSSTKKKKNEMGSVTTGPFIRMTTIKDEPASCIVVNQHQEDNDSKLNKKSKIKCPSTGSSVQISNLPSEKSVLVPRTSLIGDVWVCVLCGKGSTYKFLGDLFGPYYPEGFHPTVKSEKPDKVQVPPALTAPPLPSPLGQASNPDSSPNASTLTPISEDLSKMDSKHKRKRTLPFVEQTSGMERRIRKSSSDERGCGSDLDCEQLNSDVSEVWVHEDCVVWSDGVYLIGNKLYGLEEAAAIASATICSICKERGAMVGCLHKGCTQKYHYICAAEKGCYLDEENFSLLCPKHKPLSQL